MTVGNLVFELFSIGQELWLRVGLGIGGVKSVVRPEDLGELGRWFQREAEKQSQKTEMGVKHG